MAQLTVINSTLIFQPKDVALMELTTTLAYVILDTLDATVPLTMTIVVLLLVFMVSGGRNLRRMPRVINILSSYKFTNESYS